MRLALTQTPPHERISQYIEYSEHYLNRDPKLSLELAIEAVSEAKALSNDSLKAYGLNRMSTAYGMQGDFSEALVNILQALTIWETHNDSLGLGIGYNNLGLIYQYQNQWPEALQYHFQALEIKELIGDTLKLPYSYNNIGEIYKARGNHHKALTFFQSSLGICRRNELTDIIGHVLMLCGDAHAQMGNYAAATRYLMESMAYNDMNGDTYEKALTFSKMADVYLKQENYPQALFYFNLTENLQEHISHRDMLAITKTTIAEAYFSMSDYLQAETKAEEALELAHEIYQLEALYRGYRVMYNLAKDRTELAKAITYLENSDKYYQELLIQRRSQEIIRLQAGHDLSRKQSQIELLQERQALQMAKLEQREAQTRNRTIIAICSLVSLIGAFIAVYILYRQKQVKNRHNLILAEKNNIIRNKQEEILAQTEQLQAAYREITVINNSLEKKVKERTTQLARQNEQLAQFAFMNAHELRGPLASILGLIHLLQIPDFQQDDEIIQRLEKSSQQLDAVVRSINRTIEEEYQVDE